MSRELSKLAIIVVNYQTPNLAIDCLRSVMTHNEDIGPVIVVDNDSKDNSLTAIGGTISSENWTGVELLPLDKNGGFAAGNNAGIRHVVKGTPDLKYILLLNPDTIVRADAINELVQFMDSHPNVGIAGSRLEDPDGTPQRSAFRFPSVLGELEGGLRLGFVTRLLSRFVVAPPVRDDAHSTDWVAGASMIIRREVIDQIGLMDEDYFLYFEEVDYCRKAKRAGWSIAYVPSSRVIHLVGQSSGVTDTKTPAKKVPDYWFASRRRYFVNNHGWAYSFLANVMWAFGFGLWRIRRWIQRKPDTDPPHLLADFVRFHLWGRAAQGAS